MSKTVHNAEVAGIRIAIEVKRLYLASTWTIARGSADYKDNVFLMIEKNGICGIGEAAPNIRYHETSESTIEFLKKALPLLENYDLQNFYDLGIAVREIAPGQNAAKCAFDMAILDWNLKAQKIPLYKYLGLNKNNMPLTSFSIGIDTPEKTQQKIRAASEFPIYKIKLGTKRDIEIIKTIRSVTDKVLRVDANEGWKTKEEALEKIEWLKNENVEFVEQPMPASNSKEDHIWLHERSPLPIIADESVSDCASIHQIKDAFHGINIKLMKSGGIQEALRMIAIAKSYGLKTMLGCMVESSLAISAAVHLSPLVDYADLDGNLLITNDPYLGSYPIKGKLKLGSGNSFSVDSALS